MNNSEALLITVNHIIRVQGLLAEIQSRLVNRSINHDKSKLDEPEKSNLSNIIGSLRHLDYGSEAYIEKRNKLRSILEHHYKHNTHHPEHFPNGIDGMSLLDLIEMFCDWKAATELHTGGSLENSIIANRQRFNMSDQLTTIFENTRKELGW